MAEGVRAGEVTHFFNEIEVAVLRLIHELAVGDEIHFQGSHTDFRQTIDSMEIDHQSVETCAAGGEVAVKVDERVRPGDSVFLLTEGG
jgi:hypothetical protein